MIRIFAAAAVVLAGAVVSTSAGAAPYSALYIFKDIASAPGHQRSHAVKFADIRACGANRDDEVSSSGVHGLLNCMRARGWVVSRIERQATEGPARTPIAQSGDDQASDNSWYTTEEENADAEAADESAAETQAAASADEDAAVAQGAADAEQQGMDATNAALQAEGQPQ